jgi:hypothetical protein
LSAIDLSALQEFGKVAGIGGLALAIFFFLARQMLAMQVFANIGGEHTYKFLRLITLSAFAISIIGLCLYAIPTVVVGSGNVVIHND